MVTDMDKPANTQYPIHELIAARWSPRVFAQRPVEAGKLYRIFEAARWAASSFNEQPWGFIVATKQDEDAHRAIADCLVEGNRKWAELAGAEPKERLRAEICLFGGICKNPRSRNRNFLFKCARWSV